VHTQIDYRLNALFSTS